MAGLLGGLYASSYLICTNSAPGGVINMERGKIRIHRVRRGWNWQYHCELMVLLDTGTDRRK